MKSVAVCFIGLIGFVYHAYGMISVICIGDSITAGGGCLDESYVNLLQQQLGKSGYNFLNAGLSAQTMLKKGLCNDLSQCSYWDTIAWQTALSSQPDIVTIMLGTNDAKYFNWEGIQQNLGDYYALDYADMIRTVRKHAPLAAVYIIVPHTIYAPYHFDMNSTIFIQVFSAVLIEIATVFYVVIL